MAYKVINHNNDEKWILKSKILKSAFPYRFNVSCLKACSLTAFNNLQEETFFYLYSINILKSNATCLNTHEDASVCGGPNARFFACVQRVNALKSIRVTHTSENCVRTRKMRAGLSVRACGDTHTDVCEGHGARSTTPLFCYSAYSTTDEEHWPLHNFLLFSFFETPEDRSLGASTVDTMLFLYSVGIGIWCQCYLFCFVTTCIHTGLYIYISRLFWLPA